MKNTLFLLAVFAIFAVPNIVEAQTRKTSITVRSGNEVRIFVHSQYGSKCKGRQKAKIAIIRKPINGRVSVRKSIELVSRGSCSGKRVPGRGVFYRSKKGFKGKDTVVYDRMTPSGNILYTIEALITVK